MRFSTAIEDSKAYKNVIVNGIVVGDDGKKLSKRLKNYPDPSEMMEKYGADALRYYLMDSPVVAAENLTFSEKDMAENVAGMLRMLWNTYSFFVLYANIDKFEARYTGGSLKPENLLDKWIVSELNSLIKNVNHHMEHYELNKRRACFRSSSIIFPIGMSVAAASDFGNRKMTMTKINPMKLCIMFWLSWRN